MKVIPISGVIGWDTDPKQLRRLLDEAGGEEIEVQISSPGGFVFEGLEMFNLIRRYAGAKTTFIMGEASSMASYIALAGDRVKAADNITYMIHNVQGIAFGDYRDMAKMGEVVGGLSGLLAKAYAAKSGKSVEDIRALMDDETWYFGEEAKAAGFVDEVVPTAPEEKKDKESALAEARLHWAACRKIIGQVEDDNSLTRAAALAGELPKQSQDKKPAVGGQTASQAASTGKEVGMNPTELLKQHPECYAEVVEIGVQKEKQRVAKLMNWASADPACKDIVAEAIVSGKSAEDVTPQLMAAIKNAPENPPVVATAAVSTASGEQGKEVSDADIKAALAKLPRA